MRKFKRMVLDIFHYDFSQDEPKEGVTFGIVPALRRIHEEQLRSIVNAHKAN